VSRGRCARFRPFPGRVPAMPEGGPGSRWSARPDDLDAGPPLRRILAAAGNGMGLWCGPRAQFVSWAGSGLRSSLRVSPRRAAAGDGAGPRQRDQSERRPRRRGAGARRASDHALPVSGPAHAAVVAVARAVRDLACPSRMA